MAKITIEYCSKYASYNGEKVTEGMVLAPVMISDAEFKSNNTIIPENLKTWKHYGVPFRVGFEVVDAEEFGKYLSVYYSCVNDFIDTECPERRPGRCLLGVDSDGMPIICNKHGHNCKDCPRRDEHLPRFRNAEDYFKKISLQDTHEDEEGNQVGLEIADPKSDPEGTVLLSILLEELLTFLNAENPRYGKMIKLLVEGEEPKDIFAAVGLKSSFGYKELNRAKDLAKKFLSE